MLKSEIANKEFIQSSFQDKEFLSIKEIGYGLRISNNLKIKKLANKISNVLSKNIIKIRYPITSSITILLSSIFLKIFFLYDRSKRKRDIKKRRKTKEIFIIKLKS